jgi:hypothetical protein
MRAATISLLIALPILTACATPTEPGPGGTLTGKLVVQWTARTGSSIYPTPATR